MCFVSKLKSALKGGFFILYARLGDVETAENDSEKQKNYRVIVAHFASREVNANTPRSPRYEVSQLINAQVPNATSEFGSATTSSSIISHPEGSVNRKNKKFRVHRADLIEKVSDSPASTDNSTEAGHITADSGYYITS